MTASQLYGIDVKNGSVMWKANYIQAVESNRGGINCTSPLVKGRQFYVNGGYNQGGAMYEIAADGKSVELKWVSKVLDTFKKFAGKKKVADHDKKKDPVRRKNIDVKKGMQSSTGKRKGTPAKKVYASADEEAEAAFNEG